LEVVAKVEEKSPKVRSEIFVDLRTSLELTDEYLAPGQLGYVLRELIQKFWRINDTMSWVFQGITLLDQVRREDWKHGGFASKTQWVKQARPAGSETETWNLLTFWNAIAPKIIDAGFEIPDIVNRLSRSAVAELIAIGGKSGVDSRFMKVLCTWIVEGRTTEVTALRELKNAPLLTHSSQIMDVLTQAGRDPVEDYLDLTENEENLTERLAPIVSVITTGGMATTSVSDFIDQMKELPLSDVQELCDNTELRSGAGRAEEVFDEAKEVIEVEASTDAHTLFDFQGEEKPGGYIAIRAVLTPAQIKKLYGFVPNMNVWINGNPYKV
jgi:hypothetical protein